MGATKIINVLRDDRFEELLNIAKQSEASEVVFVLPKKTKAFKSDEQFSALNKEIKDSGKSIAFLCSNPEINELAKKYNFDVLSAEVGDSRSKSTKPKFAKQKSIVAVPVTAQQSDQEDTDAEEIPVGLDAFGDKSDDEKQQDEEDFSEEEPQEDALEDEKDYKEEKPEEVEDDPPYGTKVDDEGNIVYEEEKGMAEETSYPNNAGEFEITTASSKSRGMEDVVRPKFSRNLKVIQKDRQPVKLETRVGQSDLGWNNEQTENIWSGILKPTISNPPIFNKFKLFKKRGSKSGSSRFNYKDSQIRRVGILSLISILVLIFIIFITTGSAKIDIKPRAEKLNLQLKVLISPNFSSIDNSFNRIPGQLFTINKSATGEFNATSEKDAVQKSRGVLTVYNEYSTSPQPLVATTRFELIQENNESGLVFRTLQSITIPGMKVENGVISPGKVNVEVIADKAGQAYNIPADNFGIMAWREKGDTARYEKIYGKSSEPMHGGILGKAKVVSEFDYNNARDQLTAKVKSEIDESLRSQSTGLELSTNTEPKIDPMESTAGIDDAANMFTMTVKGSVATIGYKKDDLIALIAQYIDKTNGLMVVPDKLELSYNNMVINPTNKVLEITVNIGGNAYSKIDRESVADSLIGKNEAQIKDYLGSRKDIESAKVILSPFWVKKIPGNKEKINISLTY